MSAVSVQIGDLQEIVNRAQESPRLETNFKRYYLDIWVGQDRAGSISRIGARARASRRSLIDARWRSFPELMKGRACYGSLDLSSTNDLTCLLWLFPPEAEQKKWIVIPRFWVPADNIERRARRDRVPYDNGSSAAPSSRPTGNVVDYEPVIAAIHEGMSAYGQNRSATIPTTRGRPSTR
jgi:phage terminase large subunit-like protein